MKLATQFLTFRRLSILATCAALAACGGGAGNSADSGAAPVAAATANTLTAATVATNVSATAITDVRFQNTDAAAVQSNAPFTFGQVFVTGQVSPTDVLTGRLEDGTLVPLQMDVKATNPDGSVRHAIISGILPSVAAGATRTMSLVKGGTAPTSTLGTVSTMLKAGFTASFHAKIDGVDYYASADDLLKTAVPTSWLKGGVVNEWQVAAPLHTAAGVQHPHLSARFSVRWYGSIKAARVDVTVENDWTYEPNPQNFTYDASILVGGQTVYSKAALTHLNQSRWRKVFWFNGSEPSINIKHNVAYLISTGAVPNYDQSLVIPESSIASFQTRWNAASTEPMGSGLITPYMPTTGGRDDIGLLPNWSVTYLLTQDKRMKDIMLGTADLAGSFSSHYRDKKTGRPVSLADYPYMTVLGHYGDTLNPATGKYEAFPDCAGANLCDTPYTHDAAHQPSLAYLPYLVTGDYYYLEELEFWASWDSLYNNPYYRQFDKGIVEKDQVRGQAWALRTIADAAYIAPDKDSLKTELNNIVNSNLDYYNATYTNNPAANKLGFIDTAWLAVVYDNYTGVSPWQDDFFTSSVGHVAELGFTKANSLLAWKAQFPISRMTGQGACWIDAAEYVLKVRDTVDSPYYSSIAQVYANSHTADFDALQCNSPLMATALGLRIGEMTGWAYEPTGYPSNMQPALAYAANAGGANGKAAWDLFMSRAIKPDYTYAPQFDIVPR